MNEYVPDPLERLEAWEEQMAHELITPTGYLKCSGCGCDIQPGDCHQAGKPPFAVPECGACHTQQQIEESDQ